MHALLHRTWLPLALALTPSVAQAAGKVWVVRGAGAHFPTIQQAVDAASSGDVILVRSGVDDTVAIKGKGVWVVEDVGADARVAMRFVVRDLPANESVVLSGLTLSGQQSEALVLRSNAGSVRLQGLEVDGAPGINVVVPAGVYHPDGWSGAYVTDCQDVAFALCGLNGGPGADWSVSSTQNGSGVGAHGLEIRSSRVALYTTTASGGFGGNVLIFKDFQDGGAGGDGVHAIDSSAFLMGCALHGGDGGRGGDATPAGQAWGGGCGGWGGHGFNALGPTTALEELGLVAFGGQGGLAGKPLVSCPPVAPDGLPVRLWNGAQHHSVPGKARAFALNPVAREGQVSMFAWTGQSGDQCQVRSSPLGRFAASPGIVGPELTRGLPFTTARGLRRVAASGLPAQFPYLVPELGPGVEVRATLVQGLTFSVAGTPGAWLGAAWGLVELDAAF